MASAGARLLLFCAGLLAVIAAAASDLGSGDAGDAGAPPGNRVRKQLPADTAGRRVRRATTGLPVRRVSPPGGCTSEARDTPREEGSGSRGLASGT